MKCLNCEKDFEINENWKQDKKKKFCGSSCANSYNNSYIRYRKIELDESAKKVCIKCNQEKNVSLFYKRKGSVDGYRNDCKECNKIAIEAQPNRKLNKANYYKNNKEKVKEKVKKYSKENRDIILQKGRKYQKEHKEERNKRHKERYDNDVIYKLTCNFRTSVNKAFKRNGYMKTSKTFKLLGCSFDELKIHLEKQFREGMTWENHGEWHIDHKTPLSWCENEEHLKELCKYTNLQPLWAEENLSKKNYYSN